MSFADRAANPPAPRDLCPIGIILDGLSAEDADGLRYMLDHPERWGHVGDQSIQEALREEGYDVSDRMIRLHRGVNCKCAKAKA